MKATKRSIALTVAMSGLIAGTVACSTQTPSNNIAQSDLSSMHDSLTSLAATPRIDNALDKAGEKAEASLADKLAAGALTATSINGATGGK